MMKAVTMFYFPTMGTATTGMAVPYLQVDVYNLRNDARYSRTTQILHVSASYSRAYNACT